MRGRFQIVKGFFYTIEQALMVEAITSTGKLDRLTFTEFTWIVFFEICVYKMNEGGLDVGSFFKLIDFCFMNASFATKMFYINFCSS